MRPEADVRTARIGTLTRELWVGVSGVVLVLFIVGHLAGNLFLFGGPDAYNAYARHLHSLGPLLWVARLALLTALAVHVAFTIWLALDNRAARNTRYAVRSTACETNLAKTTMLYTGLLVFAFIALHIVDFAMGDQTEPRSVMGGGAPRGSGAGESLGLYGLVWNSFADPVHSLLYIVALCAVGLHFSNAVSTIWMTFGVIPEEAMFIVKRAAQVMGALIATAFISIPVYVLAATYLASPPH
jgi:succinate dehydrogenase / fumarate reductase cytochrome b subunit